MKYCKNCGSQIEDEAVVCVSCGCSTATQPAKSETSSTLKLIAKIFMILGCIAFGWTLIPLCCTVPMTVHYWKACKNNQLGGIGFKVCSLLFVSLIAGVLMLIDSDNN